MSTTTVEIGDRTYELVCNRRAMKKISRKTGGLIPAMQAVANVNYDTIVAIIAAGAGLDAKETTALDEALYDHGVAETIEPVSKYLDLLFNGGEAPGDRKDSDEGNGERKTAKAK